MALQNVEANITLDLYNHDTTPATVKAIQLDSQTRYVAARLQNVGVQYDVDSGATVQLIVVRPDKVGVQITGTTFTYGDESSEYLGPYAELTQVALAVNGKMRGQFKITSGDQILRTEIFAISNGEALDASTDEWADEYDGYNLEEMATSIETNTADIATLEADVSQIKEDFRDIVNSAYVTDSASGSVGHFVDGADDVPMKSVKVNIAPVQSGSGDPSPSNVRAISGWNSVKVTRSGKNVFDNQFSNRTINGLTWALNSDGTITVNGTATAETQLHTQFVSGLEGEFYFSGCPSGGSNSSYDVFIWDATNSRRAKQWNKTTDVVSELGEGNAQVYLEKGVTYRFCYRIRNGYTANNVLFSPMIRLASDTDDAYEPYNGNTYTVSLSSAGTVYGGTLDVVSGVLTVDKAIKTFNGSEAWYLSNGGMRCQTPMPADAKPNSADTALVGAMSNEFVEITPNRTWDGASGAGFGIDTNRQLNVCQTGEKTMTVDSWKTWLASHNMQIVYPLATPVTYNLTPIEVKSLLGVNNVWSDAGDIDVEYRADTKLYIDKKLEV